MAERARSVLRAAIEAPDQASGDDVRSQRLRHGGAVSRAHRAPRDDVVSVRAQRLVLGLVVPHRPKPAVEQRPAGGVTEPRARPQRAARGVARVGGIGPHPELPQPGRALQLAGQRAVQPDAPADRDVAQAGLRDQIGDDGQQRRLEGGLRRRGERRMQRDVDGRPGRPRVRPQRVVEAGLDVADHRGGGRVVAGPPQDGVPPGSVWLPERGEPHQLALAALAKTEQPGHVLVDAADADRLLGDGRQALEPGVAAGPERHQRVVVALSVDRHDKRLVERARIEGQRGVGEVVVAVGLGAVGSPRQPRALRRRPRDAEGRPQRLPVDVADDQVDVVDVQTGGPQHPLRRLHRHRAVEARARQPLLTQGADELPVDDQRDGRLLVGRVDAEHTQGARGGRHQRAILGPPRGERRADRTTRRATREARSRAGLAQAATRHVARLCAGATGLALTCGMLAPCSSTRPTRAPSCCRR